MTKYLGSVGDIVIGRVTEVFYYPIIINDNQFIYIRFQIKDGLLILIHIVWHF